MKSLYLPLHGSSRPVLTILLCTAIILGLSAIAHSALAAPGDIVRLPFGNCTILAVSDVESSTAATVLAGIDSRRRSQLVPGGKLKSYINVFVIITPDNTILVDTSMGNQGKALAALEKEGVTPDMIDTVLLTHMHPDHISGALLDGKPRYSNADLWISEEEGAYWSSDEIMMAQPRAQQPAFYQPRAVLDAYGPRVRAFAPNQALVPGITSMALPGHTQGHSGFLLESQGNRLLFWGDIIHFADIQFAAPEITVTYDHDKNRAASTRQSLLKLLQEEHISFAGAHLPFPGIGTVDLRENVLTFIPGLK